MNISFLINYECISRSLSAVYMFVVACAKYYRNCVPKNALKYHKYKTLNETQFIKESVDSVCMDAADTKKNFFEVSKITNHAPANIKLLFEMNDIY